jgi:hypothetical protein
MQVSKEETCRSISNSSVVPLNVCGFLLKKVFLAYGATLPHSTCLVQIVSYRPRVPVISLIAERSKEELPDLTPE